MASYSDVFCSYLRNHNWWPIRFICGIEYLSWYHCSFTRRGLERAAERLRTSVTSSQEASMKSSSEGRLVSLAGAGPGPVSGEDIMTIKLFPSIQHRTGIVCLYIEQSADRSSLHLWRHSTTTHNNKPSNKMWRAKKAKKYLLPSQILAPLLIATYWNLEVE